MGMDCIRWIEVYTEDKVGNIDKKYINKLGKLEIGDVILVYEGNEHWFKIIDIDDKCNFIYSVIDNEYKNAFDLPNHVLAVTTRDKLPYKNVKLNKGDIYTIYGNNPMQYDGDKFVEIEECPKSWKPLKFLNKKVYTFSTSVNFPFVRKAIYSSWGEDGIYSDRGLPNDVTDEIKQDSEDCFHKTYVSLAEIENMEEITGCNFKEKLIKACNDTKLGIIDKKVDALLNKTEYVPPIENEDYFYEDTPDGIYEDNIYDVISPHIEYNSIKTAVEIIYPGEWISDNNIRIIYGMAN